ncbi:UNVERIFIED_CONTAM: hypothetical protein Slati_2929000 [Sesamum latifolium]|uniref:Uncharacterized protein n=1 Tax=Sesamum latifolium TaxID=2727402 RepID=A0AAW2VDN2_9LAMI
MFHFGPVDAQGVHLPHNDGLVIFVTLAKNTVQCIFVDSGSSAHVLLYKVCQHIKLGNTPLELVDTSLYDFAGEVVHHLGQILIPLSLGTEPTRKIKMVHFLIVDMPSAYNVILGRPALNDFQAIA